MYKKTDCSSNLFLFKFAVSGVREANEQQKNKFGPTYLVRLQFSQPQTLGTSFIFLKLKKSPSQVVSES